MIRKEPLSQLVHEVRAMGNERVVEGGATAGEIVSLYQALVVIVCDVNRPVDVIGSSSQWIGWVTERKLGAGLSAFVLETCVRV